MTKVVTALRGSVALVGLALLIAPAAAQVAPSEAATAADASVALVKDKGLSFRLPQDEEAVVFKGVVSFDSAGGAGRHMAYPAPNLAGFVAAVITHGVLAQGSQLAEKTRLEEEADKVLTPYRPFLKDYRQRELTQRALQLMAVPGAGKPVAQSAQPGFVVQSAPVFLMTQDQSALVLDNAVAIFKTDGSSTPLHQAVIRVVARPREEADLLAFWTADQGEKLKQESASLLAASVELALNAAVGEPNGKDVRFATVRYMEGKSEKMERAQVLSEACGRRVIRTLRESIMSVPVQSGGADHGACTRE